jgi:hypothetical protein
VLVVALVTAFGGWVVDDYGLRCTKCLETKHVVVQRFLGIPLYKRTQDHKPPGDYERVFGHSCEHVFRKGGFGRTTCSIFGSGIGCGRTGEGMVLAPRISAVGATYEAEKLLHDRELVHETFQLIDSLVPPDSSFERRKELSPIDGVTLMRLAHHLHRVKTAEQWRAVLDAARQGYEALNKLPVN